MLELTDLSPADFRFNPYIGTSLRDRLRDAVDMMIRRPLYKVIYSKKFAHLPYPIDLVLPEKGMSTLTRRQWVNRYVPLHNSRILVIGCGTAWDFGSYLRFKPREIIGVDLYNFARCWKQVQDYVAEAGLPTQVTFHQADIAQLEKILSGEFDIIASDDVFEHCRDLKSVLKTLYSLLRPEGIMYAGYGPLYYTWGGDHFSGRGGIDQGYNHLILDSSDYKTYYHSYLQNDRFEIQNGGRYIKIDLFSRLTTREYFEIYKQTRFCLKSAVIYFSGYAEYLKSKKMFKIILKKHAQINVDDLLIKSHYIILSKSLKENL